MPNMGKIYGLRSKKIKNGNDLNIRLTIENLKGDTGGYGDTIILQTDSSIQPEIRISVYGRILPGQGKD